MEEAMSDEVPNTLRARNPHAMLQMLCELANINISQARAEADTRKRSDHLLQASQHIEKARNIAPTDQLVYLTSAHLLLANVSATPPTCQFRKAFFGQSVHNVTGRTSNGCPTSRGELLIGGSTSDAPIRMQNEVEKAKAELRSGMKATTDSKATVAGTVALANILFQQKRFSEAHRFYCQVSPRALSGVCTAVYSIPACILVFIFKARQAGCWGLLLFDECWVH